MTASIDKSDLQRRMHGAVEALKHDLSGLRTGRASTALLDTIHVEVYGANMPLNQVATVSVPEPRLLTVQVWDRSNVQPVEKAIRSANLGLNPVTDGQLVRLPIPDLTEERRKELAKLVGQYAEKAKVAVRNVRRDGMEHLKADEKKHDISEDERKRLEQDVQKLTDDTIKEIDQLSDAKEKEILGKCRQRPLRKRGRRLPAVAAPCLVTLPSSWTATAAGRSSGGFHGSPGTRLEPRPSGAPCRPPRTPASRC